MHELQHHFFEFAFRHLSVADDDSRRRNESLELGGDFPDGVDAVVDEIDLAAALEFLLNGGLDQLLVPTGDDGLDRHAIFRAEFRSRSCRAGRRATCAECAGWAWPTW